LSDEFYSELSDARKCYIAIDFRLWFRICHQEALGMLVGLGLNGRHQLLVYIDVDLLG
jgi:hypothetical protein